MPRLPFLPMALLLGCGCTAAGAVNPSQSWEAWRSALLTGTPTGELPSIPTDGWRRAAPGVWIRQSDQASDYDGDGRVDYLRVVDPPNSYRYFIWVDHDRDGFFDHGPGIPEPAPRADPRQRVPSFAPIESSPAPSW